MTMKSSDYVASIVAAAAKDNWAEAGRYLGELKVHLDTTGAPLSEADAYRIVAHLSGISKLRVANQAMIDGLVGEILAAARSVPPNMTVLGQRWQSLDGLLADASIPVHDHTATELLSGLRESRAFSYLGKTADRFLTRGDDRPVIRRLYAQALIDEGYIKAAIDVLTALLGRSDLPADERAEAQGLLGRAYKQVYVNHVQSPVQAAALKSQLSPALQDAIKHYASAYNPAAPGANFWHGGNYIALLMRAQRDGVAVHPPVDATVLAKNLVEALGSDAEANGDIWKLATLGEAHIALQQYDKAAKYYSAFARSKTIDEFKLAATIRQLEQVWQLQAGPSGGGAILAGLKAIMAERANGMLVLSGTEQRTIARADPAAFGGILETMLPGAARIHLETLRKIVQRASAVCSIRKKSLQVMGTGFLIRGSALSDTLGDEIFLLTNAHVVSDPKKNGKYPGSLDPADACVYFESEAGVGEPRRYTCDPEVVWQSPVGAHDAALLRLDTRITHIEPLVPGFDVKLVIDDDAKEIEGTRLAVIGHPEGQDLSLLLSGDITDTNGTLIDMGPKRRDEDDPVYLHYKTPTAPGNSGSPVFETENWNLVCLHHAGFSSARGLPRLRGESGFNVANEGIDIHSIRRAIDKDPPAKTVRREARDHAGQNHGMID